MKRLGPEDGAIFVEFLIVFMVFLTIVLGIVQLTFLYIGKAVVQRSANAGVRAAVVVLDDDPRCYGGAARNSPTGKRLEDIRMAAKIPLLALSADRGTVRRAIGEGVGGAGASMAYAESHMALTFPSGGVGLESDVTVRVEFQYNCGVPLGRFVLCGMDQTLTLTGEATLPNQGARYRYQGPPMCGG